MHAIRQTCEKQDWEVETESSSSLQQLQDGEDNVVNVAETGGLGLLGVVESSSPVDGDVCLLLVQL